MTPKTPTYSNVVAAIEEVRDALDAVEEAEHGSEDQGCATDAVVAYAQALLHLVDEAVTY